jgi:soluble lytic murein transglycosylase-like protein
VGRRQEIHAAAISPIHRAPYHRSRPRRCALTLLHSLPQRSLPLTFAVIASATLFTLAADQAYAPEGWSDAADICLPEDSFAEAPRDPAEAILVKYLSRRFLIAAEATERMVGAAYSAAHEVGLDPLLVLAVISIESRFNPIAESVMGAKGLMQIIPKYHPAKMLAVGGEAAVWDPESNIHMGARILQEYVYRTGTLEAGLQFYNGAFADGRALYAQRVMAERERLLEVVQGRGALVAMHGG